MDSSRQNKLIGRGGEWGKLSKAYRKNANKRTRRFAAAQLRKLYK